MWHDPEFQKKLGLKYDATYHTDLIIDQQRRVLKEFGVEDLEIVRAFALQLPRWWIRFTKI